MDRIASTFIDRLVLKDGVSAPILYQAVLTCGSPLQDASDDTLLIGLDAVRLTLPPSLGTNTLSGARAR